MSSLKGFQTASASNTFETSTQDIHGVGNLSYDSQGRFLRWVKAGGSAISRGKLQTSPAPITAHHEMAVDTIAQGETIVTGITPGATAGAANLYAGGFLVVNDDTGEGMAYEINRHAAITASTAFSVTLKEPIEVAFGAGTTVTLVHNPWSGVIEGTSSTAHPVGIAANNIAAGAYGWVISKGIAPALADETIRVGSWVSPGTSVAGAVEEYDDVTTVADSAVGWAIVAGVDTEYRPIYVDID